MIAVTSTSRKRPRQDDLARLIADRIATAYNLDVHRAETLAAVCDETADRSGNLLGWIREYAALATAKEAEG